LTRPAAEPPRLAGVGVFLEDITDDRLHVTLYQTGPATLDWPQTVELLEAALDIARGNLPAGHPEQKDPST
jgi:hypothetical protein